MKLGSIKIKLKIVMFYLSFLFKTTFFKQPNFKSYTFSLEVSTKLLY